MQNVAFSLNPPLHSQQTCTQQLAPIALRNPIPHDDVDYAGLVLESEENDPGCCAGSLAAGTGVGRMRWLMQVTQDCTRYDNSENQP